MFKYVWIIMLAIAAVIFIGYTIYAIYDSYCMAVRWATRFDCGCDIKWILSETLSNFWCIHYVLYDTWIAIFLIIIVATFLFNVSAYCIAGASA